MSLRSIVRADPPRPALHAWAMLPTPFSADASSIDHASLERVTIAALEAGCTDLVALGVIAEPETLTPDERLEVLRTVRGVAGDARVTACVLDPSTPRASAEAAALSSALRPDDRIMCAVPTADPEQLRRHARRLHEASARPIAIQDYARAAGVTLAARELADLATAPYIEAIKEETAPTYDRIRRLAEVPDVTVVGGAGGASLVDDLLAGAHGLAIGITRPDLLVAAMSAWADGRPEEASARVGAIAGLISFETQPGRSVGVRKEHWRRWGAIDHATVRRAGEAWTAELDAHTVAHLTACPPLTRRP